MSDVREVFDIVFDRLIARLESYAADEAAADPGRAFVVRSDNTADVGATADDPASVFAYAAELKFKGGEASSARSMAYEAVYYLDCVSVVPTGSTFPTPADADAAVGARLRYLVTQVIRALWTSGGWDFDLPIGVVGRLAQPEVTISWNDPSSWDDPRHGVHPARTRRVVMTVELAWDVGEVQGVPLNEIHIDTGRWSGLYQLEGRV